MAGCRRWISSMNRTSRGCRLVRMAARSPARWITGPEVARKPTPELAGDDLGERGLAEAGGAVQQHVVQRLAAGAGGLDEDGEVLARGFLADEFRQGLRAEGGLGGVLGAAGGGDGAVCVAHAAGVRGYARVARKQVGESKSGTTDAHGCTQIGRRVPKQRGSVGLDPEVWPLNRMQAAVPSVCICSVCTCVHLWFQSLALPALARAGTSRFLARGGAGVRGRQPISPSIGRGREIRTAWGAACGMLAA